MGETIEEIPAGRRHIIERPRLTRLLDETSARVIMLVAPAGYGKTTLARQWLRTRPHAWYQASAASADLAALSGGLAGACDALLGGIGARLREWLPTRRGTGDDPAVAADLLSTDLKQWPSDTWVAIDDYHYLDSSDAEEMIERLVAQTDIQVLLTGRRRPTWATSRRILYGEIFELSQDVLAMDSAEADEVLAGRSDESSRALLSLANGWPAVIALAATTHAKSLPTDGGFPSTLHDYLVDELFSTLSYPVRRALCEVALIPSASASGLVRFLGKRRARVLREEVPVGVISYGPTDELLVHPLLRAFLLRKFLEFEEPYRSIVVTRATRLLMTDGRWEEAFSLIQRFGRSDLLDELITACLYDLLRQGRLATLRAFADYARQEDLASPSLDLANAEYAFRQGFHERARTLARQAAEVLPPKDPLTSKAFCRAGLSAYFVDEWAEAIDDLLTAKELARNPDDLREAIWNYFVVAIELGDSEASTALNEFAGVGRPSADDLVRLQSGKLLFATRYGGLAEALAEAQASLMLVAEAKDPIGCASFLHIYSAALRLAGCYVESERALETAFEGVTTFNLDFARPHLALTKAATTLGLRRYQEAAVLLDDVERFARERNDVYVLMNALAWHCRLLLLRGQANAALAVTAHAWPRLPCRGQYSEFLSCRALAFARTGDLSTAHTYLDEAHAASQEIEAQSLCKWTRALLSCWATPAIEPLSRDAVADVHAAFAYAHETGALDSFVFAYRLDDGILTVLSQNQFNREQLARVLARTKDSQAARVAGLDTTAGLLSPLDRLTKRELQVYELLAHGRSNKDIARALFVSEATVKVHVRHILKKLNVRTRTEAAVLAAKMPLLAE